MLIFLGVLNIAAAILVPLYDHLFFPGEPLTYMPSDAKFTGLPWQQVISLSPALGLWIVLQMNNMCARMMGGGILASAISVKGFRRSRKWAYNGLLVGFIMYLVPFYLTGIPLYQAGISEATTVSFGAPPDPNFFFGLLLFVVPAIVAFVLPISHFRRRIKTETP